MRLHKDLVAAICVEKDEVFYIGIDRKGNLWRATLGTSRVDGKQHIYGHCLYIKAGDALRIFKEHHEAIPTFMEVNRIEKEIAQQNKILARLNHELCTHHAHYKSLLSRIPHGCTQIDHREGIIQIGCKVIPLKLAAKAVRVIELIKAKRKRKKR
jgi:hypothetical protein